MLRKFIGLMSMVLVVATVAFADKLPPNLSTFPVAGESELYDSTREGYSGNVDWLVLAPGDYTNTIYEPFVLAVFGSPEASEYLYLYQVEGRAVGNNSFTIYVTGPWSGGGTFTTDDDTTALDLDDVHNSSTFPYLSGEFEVANASLVRPERFRILNSPLGDLFQWTWVDDTLDENEESYVLFITSPAPPTYGQATLKDTYSGQTFTIAVPSPEPASFVLLLMGVAASGVILRRKTK
jgi:hypothetical protein